MCLSPSSPPRSLPPSCFYPFPWNLSFLPLPPLGSCPDTLDSEAWFLPITALLFYPHTPWPPPAGLPALLCSLLFLLCLLPPSLPPSLPCISAPLLAHILPLSTGVQVCTLGFAPPLTWGLSCPPELQCHLCLPALPVLKLQAWPLAHRSAQTSLVGMEVGKQEAWG